jgi:hypothetical protein
MAGTCCTRCKYDVRIHSFIHGRHYFGNLAETGRQHSIKWITLLRTGFCGGLFVNTVKNGEISGSQGEEYEYGCLLGCCAV